MIRLADVEERRALSGGKFHLPTRAERESLRQGDHAKVIFECDAGGERMWLAVKTPLDGDGRYSGVLSNDPIVVRDVKVGDMIEFGPENVCGILKMQ